MQACAGKHTLRANVLHGPFTTDHVSLKIMAREESGGKVTLAVKLAVMSIYFTLAT
jgi:hypothetical protein